ncbi:type I-D CRISPR-associated protein Cas10d/Csc3 [Trichormus azollae]|uniref:type I-D CRISPR-associated protein Cas10d/Csc3 n=1 Tax=Trichormus azollae TaxID=1164 RepID=UPI003D35734A
MRTYNVRKIYLKIIHNTDKTVHLNFLIHKISVKHLTFDFMALPPGRAPTDTLPWVMPSWLGFALPIILGVKIVVSESPIPPLNDGTKCEESVFLDSAPHAFRVLVGRDKFRLDYILEG